MRCYPILLALLVLPTTTLATPPCGMQDAASARAAWERGDAAERGAIERQWSPLYEALGPAVAREACFQPSGVYGLSDIDDFQAESEHFALWSVAYVSEDQASQILGWLEAPYAELVAQGWRPPPQSEEHQIVVALKPLSGVAGYTWWWPCGSPGEFMPYLVLDPQWLHDTETGAQIAAHELFHAFQMAYIYDDAIAGWDTTQNRWWVEASAVYAESILTNQIEMIEIQSAYWSMAPWRSLRTHDASGHQYDSFLFALSLEDSLQGSTWFRELFDQIADRSGYDLVDELDDLLTFHGSSFEDEFDLFLSRTAEMDLPRFDWLIGPRDLSQYWGVPDGTTAQLFPSSEVLEGEVLADDPEAPEELGANYLWVAGSSAREGTSLELLFEGEAKPNGVPVRWSVQGLGSRAGSVTSRFVADPEPFERDGEPWVSARLRLDGFDDAHDGAWLVVSPRDAFAPADTSGERPGAAWRYEVKLIERGSSEPAWTQLDRGAGCSCEQAASPAGAWALLLLPLLRARLRGW